MMNPPSVTPVASSDLDLEKGLETKECEDCNAEPGNVLGSGKGSRAEGCEVYNADRKDVLLRLQFMLHNGTLSVLRR